MFTEDFPRLEFVWSEATFGTPPFSMGFNFGITAGPTDLEDAAEAAITAWGANSTTLGYLTASLGPCEVVCTGIYSGVVDQYTATGGATPTGSPVDLPGVSVRFVAGGNRPYGGRRGSWYLPGLEGAGADEDGFLNGTYRTNLQSWMNDIITAVEVATSGLDVVTLHNINGSPSFTVVPDCTVAATVSFLRRRYR